MTFLPHVRRTFRALEQTLFERERRRRDAARRAKTPRFEALESREMLSVSTFEYQDVRANYPDANLPESKYDVVATKLSGADVSLDKLKQALQTASETPQDDLILIDATDVGKLTFAQKSDEIRLDFDSATRGTVSVIVVGARPLTLDAANLSRVLSVGTQTTAFFGAFVFQNGTASDGGQTTNALGETYRFGAGGAVLNRGELTLVDVSIRDSTATFDAPTANGLGFNAGGGALYNAGTAKIVRGTFANNRALSSESGFANIATFGAGGAFFNDSGAALTLVDATVAQNVAQNGVLTKTIVSEDEQGNRTEETVQIYQNGAGGGIYDYGGTVALRGVVLSGGDAAFGGGIYVVNSTVKRGDVELDQTSVVGNSARYSGAGLYLASGIATATNSLVAGNVANEQGGGLYVENGSAYLQNATVAGNSAATGGGLYAKGGRGYCYNSIIAAAAQGGDVAVADGKLLATRTLSTFSNWVGNSAQNFVYDAARALFVDLANGNCRLAANSQARDLGARHAYLTTAKRDLENNTRIVGTAPDLGAFEYAELKPTVATSAANYVVQEDEQLLLTATSTEKNARFFWDLTGTLHEDDANFVEGPAEFFMSPQARNLAPGVYKIRVKTKLGDVESDVATATLRVESKPTIAANVDVLGETGIVRLALSVGSFDAPARWSIDWGDGSTTTVSELSTSIVVARRYAPTTTAKSCVVRVSLVDFLGNGEGVSYAVATIVPPVVRSNAILESLDDAATPETFGFETPRKRRDRLAALDGEIFDPAENWND